ncbi:alpha/beta hydrolase [Kribbella sp. HUAS MG21]|uniref:Alpha/beta hydrolase n=1 Tax=Kribbella sp. HUAS MG21 TaxID=3160966 RepID=A0AAU7TFE2_9ACTN
MTIQLERTGVTTRDGVRLNVEVTGPADAPVTVLLVHGWTCSTRSWHNQVEGLPQVLGADAVRVVTYDHRGHGRSEAAPAGSMRIDQLAEDLVTVLDEVVGDGPVVYAGHSMGGMTLMAAADQYPDLFGSRIRAAALVSTSSGQITAGALGLPKRFEPAAAAIAPRAMNLVGAGVDRRTARRVAASTVGLAEEALAAAERASRGRVVAGKLSAQVQRSGLRRLVFGKRPDPAEVELFLADLAVVPGPSYGGFFEAILQHDLGHALKILDELPVEIMHGTRDRLLPPRHANRIATQLPSARLWIYPGAGHMLMQERPRDVTHRLASLARKVT